MTHVITTSLPSLHYQHETQTVSNSVVKVEVRPGFVAVSAWISGQHDRALRITWDRSEEHLEDEVLLEINEAGFTHGPVELLHPAGGTLAIERYNVEGNQWSPGELSNQLVIHCRRQTAGEVPATPETTENSTSRFLALVDEKLDQVLSQPQGWGGADALEPLVLALSMLRARTVDPTSTDQDVLRAYRKLLAQRLGAGAGDLRSRLDPQCSVVDMVRVLSEHVTRIQRAGEKEA